MLWDELKGRDEPIEAGYHVLLDTSSHLEPTQEPASGAKVDYLFRV